MVKGRAAVRRVVCAVETGAVINPGLVKANIEGGKGFALTNTLRSEITFAKGVVEQDNFDNYPLLTPRRDAEDRGRPDRQRSSAAGMWRGRSGTSRAVRRASLILIKQISVKNGPQKSASRQTALIHVNIREF